MTEVSKTNFEV